MPEVSKQKVLQLKSVLGSNGACKFSHTFSMEKPLNYVQAFEITKWTYVYDVYVVKTCQYIISTT